MHEKVPEMQPRPFHIRQKKKLTVTLAIKMIIFTLNILVGQAVQTQIRHYGVWHLIRVSTDRFQTALSNFVVVFFFKKR